MRPARTLVPAALIVAALGAVLGLVFWQPDVVPPVATTTAPTDDPLAGWSILDGPLTDAGPESSVSADLLAAVRGRRSIRLSGDDATRRWKSLRRDFPAQGLDRVTLRLLVRSRGVAASERPQADEAAATLSLLSATGRRFELHATPALAGDHDWTEFILDALAPHGTVTARVELALTRPGTMWFDDVRLDVTPATAEDAAGREHAFDALAGHLRRTYPFFGVAGRPQADALFARFRAFAVASLEDREFVHDIRLMLAELDDPEVSTFEQVDWTASSKRTETARPSGAPPNWNEEAIRATVTSVFPADCRGAMFGRIGDGPDAVGYVRIDWFGPDLVSSEVRLDAVSEAKSLILDLRQCDGREESAASRIAGRFTAEPVVYARSDRRDPFADATDAFLPPIDRVLQPVSPGKADARRVVVLQGPYCDKATEAFLLMMRALPNVTTIGLPTRGALGDPVPFDLLPGVKVWSPRRRVLTPDGECIEGKGVAPEIVVEGSHAKSDPTLERALAELR